MTTSDSQHSVKNPFAYLAPQEFVVLTTYRRDGRAVPTTVWFAYDQGKVYITTSTAAGKMKRVRNNGRVQMVPSDRVGNLIGQPGVDGTAREALTDEERARALGVLEQKYGEQFRRIAGQNMTGRTYMIVEPAA